VRCALEVDQHTGGTAAPTELGLEVGADGENKISKLKNAIINKVMIAICYGVGQK
jgi:hypothetical protein